MPKRMFHNDGGELIALDAADAASWRGEPGPDEAPGGVSGTLSDYERASKAGYPAGVIPVAAGHGVVIGAEEGIATAWWHTSASGEVFLIGCVFGDDRSDDDLIRDLGRQDDPEWTRLGTTAIRSGKLFLFHAACDGSDLNFEPKREFAVIGDGVVHALSAGNYALAAREVSIPDRALYNVAKWTRL